MGHIRLGRLPKTQRWSRVVALLASDEGDPAAVAAAIVSATGAAYAAAGDDPAVAQSVRLMAQLAVAARSDDFARTLSEAGLPIDSDTDAVAFLRQVFLEADRRFGPRHERTIFTEFATAALREALTETVAAQPRTLFSSGLDDVQTAYRSFSTERGFARLARLFFAHMLSRSLRYFTDQEASNQLGSDGRFGEQAELIEFNRSLDRYSFEAARIVEDFSGAWFSKRLWHRDAEERAAGFAAIAMRKLAAELAQAQ